MKMRVAGTVLDEKHQMLYIFQENVYRVYEQEIGNGGWQINQRISVNLSGKTFRTESNEMLLSGHAEFCNLIPVMVGGDVIYNYHNRGKSLKCNVETDR